jgi:hypothetical protein
MWKVFNIMSKNPTLTAWVIMNPAISGFLFYFLTTDKLFLRVLYISMLSCTAYSTYLFRNKLKNIIEVKMIKV